MKIKSFTAFLILVFVLSACSPGQVFGPTYTPTATTTSTPTATATTTPTPTSTPMPTPTSTPTPAPTNCPVEKVKFVYPVNGQTIGYDEIMLFMVKPVACASQFAWKFYQNDELILDQVSTSTNQFGITPYTAQWEKFKPGYIKVSVQYKQNDDTFSEPTTISLYLQQ